VVSLAGTQWAQSLPALVAEVPSIVVPEESNVLLNPRHPDAAQLVVLKVRRWTYDARLG
jgi:RES domain-containing protein